MDNEIVQEVLSRIDSLGELGQQGFEVIVRQAYIEGVSRILAGLLLLALSIALLVAAWRAFDERLLLGRIRYEEASLYRWRTGDTLALWLGATGGLLLLPGMIYLWSGTKWLINPEFYAIRYLLNVLG